MVSWLERHGFEVTWGENGSLKLLRENLSRGIPTLVEWIDWGGHWVIVVGYDTRGTESERDDVIYFADPADGLDEVRDGLTSFHAKRFESMWFDAFLFDAPCTRFKSRLFREKSRHRSGRGRGAPMAASSRCSNLAIRG